MNREELLRRLAAVHNIIFSIQVSGEDVDKVYKVKMELQQICSSLSAEIEQERLHEQNTPKMAE